MPTTPTKIEPGSLIGSWEVIECRGKKTDCRCVCGTARTILTRDLKRGATKSCGCQRGKRIAQAWSKKTPEELQSRRDKSVATNLKMRGVEHNSQSLEWKEKFAETMLGRHGVANPFQSELFKAKIKRTNLERYGAENPSQAEPCKRRRESTMVELYGSENASLVPVLCSKRSETNMERYGVPSLMCLPERQAFLKQRVMELYGSENFFASDAFAELAASSQHWRRNQSRGELELRDFVNGLSPASHGRVGRFEIDVLCKDLRIGFEYNGSYWHSELFRDPKYHRAKTDAAKNLGITLIHVADYEWQSRRTQVEGRIRSLLGCNKKIYARKCRVVELESKAAISLINAWHIQPVLSAPYSVGLEIDNQIVAVAIFGHHHRSTDKRPVLTRFACTPGITVTGGLSRLCKRARAALGSEIISWVDLRWSDGSGYLASGWEIEAKLRPTYVYYSLKSRKIISKQSRRKSAVGTADGITEHQHAAADGLVRIWDCGKLRVVFR